AAEIAGIEERIAPQIQFGYKTVFVAAGTTGGVNRLEAVHRQIAPFIIPRHVSLSEMVTSASPPSLGALAAEISRINQRVAVGVQLADISVRVTIELRNERACRREVFRFCQPGDIRLVFVINRDASVANDAVIILVIAAAEISRVDERAARRVQLHD